MPRRVAGIRFAPGPTNTIRNRVTGAENIGAAMNVACAFENVSSYDYGKYPYAAGVQIANNGECRAHGHMLAIERLFWRFRGHHQQDDRKYCAGRVRIRRIHGGRYAGYGR